MTTSRSTLRHSTNTATQSQASRHLKLVKISFYLLLLTQLCSFGNSQKERLSLFVVQSLVKLKKRDRLDYLEFLLLFGQEQTQFYMRLRTEE